MGRRFFAGDHPAMPALLQRSDRVALTIGPDAGANVVGAGGDPLRIEAFEAKLGCAGGALMSREARRRGQCRGVPAPLSLLAFLALGAAAQAETSGQGGPLAEAQGSTIGYPSVAAALAALEDRPDVTRSLQGGWTIVEDRAADTLWSFAPPGHPAYPAAVKRQVVDQDGAVYVRMSVQCEASKKDC